MIVHFYGSGERQQLLARAWAWIRLWALMLTSIWLFWIAPAQRRRLLTRYRMLTDIAFSGCFHVDVQIGAFLWTWGPIGGCRLIPVGCRPLSPHHSLPLTIRYACLSAGQWVDVRNPPPLRTMLYTMGCPFVREQPSCSMMTARLIGITRVCRRPSDVARAIAAGDFNGN